MVECKYCDEEFDSETKMHLHWRDEHEDELNSHDEEKVKKAEREKEKQKQKKMSRRKKLAGQGLAIGGALIVVAVLGYQALGSLGGPSTSGPTAELDLEGQPLQGNPDANVTVVEFGDYSCPHCRTFDVGAHQQLENEYIESGEVNFYFVNYAFLGPESTTAAVASECVHRQTEGEQFWDFHSGIFEVQSQLGGNTVDTLMEVARQKTEGLDYQSLESCIRNRDTLDEVQSDRRMGSQNGVDSTPTIFVNGRKMPRSDFSTLKTAIEQELG